MWSHAQFWALLAAGALLAACGDDGDGAPDGDAGPGDGATICGEMVCEAFAAGCGAGRDICGGLIDCGACTYVIEPVQVGARAPAIAIGDVPTIAYALDDGMWGIHVARREVGGWSGAPVVHFVGEPAGRADLAIAADGTRWVVYSDDTAQIWVAHAPVGKTWTIEGPLASGATVAISIGDLGEPVVALAGLVETTSGVFVARRAAGDWNLVPVGDPASAGAPRSLAVVALGDEAAVVWRDPADDAIRYARGRDTSFAVEMVDPGSPAPIDDGALSLAFGPLGKAHVVYGRGTGELVYAVRLGETWQSQVIASDQADHDDAFAIDLSTGLHVAFFASGGLHVLDGIAGAWLGQIASDQCSDGDLDLALDALGEVHVAFACADAVRHLVRSGPI